MSSESGLVLCIAFAILSDPPGFRWIRDGRGMIEAAEDAALTGHWLRCEHSRSVIEECQRQRFRSSQALRGGGQLPLPPQIIEEDLAGFRILSSGSARLPVDPAAEGAALAGHWLRCEHSRSVMVDFASGSGPGSLRHSGARPVPSSASNHRGKSRRFRIWELSNKKTCSLLNPSRGLGEQVFAVFDAFRFLTFQNVDAVIVAALDG